MKKTLIILSFVLLYGQFLRGQVVYEKGYIVDNKGAKIACLIKNSDWRLNPKELTYKLSEGGEVLKGNVQTVQEFGIPGDCKYIRAKVSIDRSTDFLIELSTDRMPQWTTDELFLKVLVQGRASLYMYEDNSIRRFFYSAGDSLPVQLIHKSYLSGNQVQSNDAFREQLWTNLRLENAALADVTRIEYRQSDLQSYFRKYNAGHGYAYSVEVKKSTGKFHLYITPGIDFVSGFLSYAGGEYQVSYAGKSGFRLGAQLEYVLPFNKNKWSVLIDPAYGSYKRTEQFVVDYPPALGGPVTKTSDIDYSSIEFPVGIRYYIFLPSDIKVYFNAFVVPPVNIMLKKKLDIGYDQLDLKAGISAAIGMGISYKRIGLEMRYYLKQQLLSDYADSRFDYNKLSLLLTVGLF
jgi:hypothetical protein